MDTDDSGMSVSSVSSTASHAKQSFRYPLHVLTFATCGLLTTSISWEAVKKISQQLTERLEKTAAGYGLDVSLDKSIILVNGIKPSQKTNI